MFKTEKRFVELEERILQLEKRIEEVKIIDRKRGQLLDEAIGEKIQDINKLELRIQKLERKKKGVKNET